MTSLALDSIKVPDHPGPVVYIDDDRALQDLVGVAFQRSDVPNRLSTITAGAACRQYLDELEAGSEPTPSLILVDVNMLDPDGFTIVRRLRSMDHLAADLTIGVFSGSDYQGDADEALAAGANWFMKKPLDVLALRFVTIESTPVPEAASTVQTPGATPDEQAAAQLTGQLFHELRGPVTNLKGYLDLSLDPAADHSTDEILWMVDRARRSADRLAWLVDRLQLRNRLEQRQVPAPLEPIDVAELCNKVISATQAEPATNGDPDQITVELDPVAEDLVPATGVESLLVRSLTDLVHVSAALSDKRSPVKVTAYRRDPEQVTVEISEYSSAIGIDELKELYAPFGHTVPVEVHPSPGTVFAIANLVAERCSGTFTAGLAESGDGATGTTFSLSLPICSADRQIRHERLVDRRGISRVG